MELCGPLRALPTLPNRRPFAPNSCLLPVLPRPTSALFSGRSLAFRPKRGWRATASEETSTRLVSTELGAESDEEKPEKVEVASFEAGYKDEEAPSSGGYKDEEAPSSGDQQIDVTELLSKLNLKIKLDVSPAASDVNSGSSRFIKATADHRVLVKLDPEDTYAFLPYGAGALVALWISSVIISAVDSLPLLPKAMELVGLAFTVWFSYRYLIFKKNRDEWLAKIDDFKEQVLGPSDD